MLGRKILFAWLLFALVFWAAYFVTQPATRSYTSLYYYVWLLLFGIPTWYYRNRIAFLLKQWSSGPFFKFVSLGLMMVAIEEVLAALFNHLDEGFYLATYLARVGQFELFNLWAFTGLFGGAYLVIRKVRFSHTELFYLFGTAGLGTEGIIALLFGDQIMFLLTAPIVIFTYGLVAGPAILSLPDLPRRDLHPALRHGIFLASSLILFAICVAVLMMIARHYPWLIPPHTRNF